ncbi:MAG: holo-ACP synthase [Vampirovibrionales bacterium]
MSIQVLGVDLIHLRRIERGIERFGTKWLRTFLTFEELWDCLPLQQRTPYGLSFPHTSPDLCPQLVEATYHTWPKESLRRVAGKIAVKEALSKALGTGLCGLGYQDGIRWQDIQVLPESITVRRPCLTLTGKALTAQAQQGITRWLASITHDEGLIYAQVIGISHTS